jgi:putative membrane protein insertion efficiency factor
MNTRTDLKSTLRAGLRGLAVTFLSAPIYLYRYTLSPLLPPSCRFTPSCSVYALEALKLHGPLRGSWLALRRLSHCHPIALLGGRSGHDPVPKPVPPR